MSYYTPKQQFLNNLKALNGGDWDKMSKVEKYNEWERSMDLRRATGNKTWVNPFK